MFDKTKPFFQQHCDTYESISLKPGIFAIGLHHHHVNNKNTIFCPETIH